MQNQGRSSRRRGGGKSASRPLDGFGEKRTADVAVNWDEVVPDQLAAVVVAVVGRGGAVMFGRSRDGGVLSVTIFLDGDRRTLWCDGADGPEGRLREVYDFFDGLPE